MNASVNTCTISGELPLKERIRKGRGKFAAMAGTYFVGVFNDNFFKQAALLMAVAAGRSEIQGYATIIFTLPFIVFAAQAGWCADRFSKRSVVIAAKTLELVAMIFGALGVLYGNWVLILVMLGIEGTQATIFSPALNGSIPELYPAEYVITANAIIKMISTAAILIGIAVAGFVLDLKGSIGTWPLNHAVVAVVVIGISVCGVLMSFGVAKFPAASPKAKFPWYSPRKIIVKIFYTANLTSLQFILIVVICCLFLPLGLTGIVLGGFMIETLIVLYKTRLDSLLAISIAANMFFWFIGSLNVLAINELGLSQFKLSNSMTSVLVVAELVGIAVGGLLSIYLAKKIKWYRLLAQAAAVMAVCMAAVGAMPYFAESAQLACLLTALAVLGIAGGVFVIPLESFIQVRPAADRKGATIAAANFAAFSGILLSGPTLNLFNWLSIRPSSDFAIMGAMAVVVAILLFVFLRKRTTDD